MNKTIKLRIGGSISKRPSAKIHRALIRDMIIRIEGSDEVSMKALGILEEDMGIDKEVVVLLLGILVQWDLLFPMMEWVEDGEMVWVETWATILGALGMEWVEAWVT